jgi:hypothetical protein
MAHTDSTYGLALVGGECNYDPNSSATTTLQIVTVAGLLLGWKVELSDPPEPAHEHAGPCRVPIGRFEPLHARHNSPPQADNIVPWAKDMSTSQY